MCAIFVTASTWGYAVEKCSTIADIRKMVHQEIPYQFGAIQEITIVPDQNAVLLKCGDNPEKVKEFLIGADQQIIYIYCIRSSGAVSSIGSKLGECIGFFDQIKGSAAIGIWQREGEKIRVKFQLTNDDDTIIQFYRKLEKTGKFSRRINNWKTLLDNPEKLFPPLTAEQRVEAFARLWSTVKFNFANFDLVPELNWDNVLSEYLPKVMREQSNNEYILLLRECIARLKDGHTDVHYTFGDGLPTACPLLKIQPVDGKAIVMEIADTNETKASGIKAGDEITHIDGCPVQEVLKKNIYPYISASTPQDRDLKAYIGLLCGEVESKVSLTIKTLKGEVRTVSLTRKSNGLALLPYKAPHTDLEYRDLGNGLAYVALNSFGSDEIVKAFKEKLKDINKAKALLIDVRENGGGNSQYGDEIIACLIDKPVQNTRWKTPQYRAAFRAWGNDEQWFNGEIDMLKPKTANPFPGPIVVLIGPETASAAEDFVVPLHAAGRIIIVGQKSAGSTGQPLQFRFLDGKIAGRVCTRRVQYPDGREFVGVGIIPDVEVGPTPADIASGNDVVLEKGLEVLRNKIK